MAKLYGQLPSYVRDNATTFDITVTSAVLAWEKEQYDKANGVPPTQNLSQEQMKAMIKTVRKQHERNSKKTTTS
jgi:thiamine biosynthesis lipoprotein ApbE